MTNLVWRENCQSYSLTRFVRYLLLLGVFALASPANAHSVLIYPYLPFHPAEDTPDVIGSGYIFPADEDESVYYQYHLVSRDPSCSATLTLEKTAGPDGIMSAPTPPAGAVMNWDFTFSVIANPPPFTTVTYKLVWKGIGGPGANCGTNSEPKTLNFALSTFRQDLPSKSDTASNNLESGDDGDPVDTFNGELYTREPADLRLGGPIPLLFSRYYGAHLNADDNVVPTIGQNWLHNYQWDMVWVMPNPGTSMPRIISPRGRVIEFDEDLNLINQTDVPYQLVYDSAAYEYSLLDPTSNLLFVFGSFIRSPLKRIEDGHGNVLTFTYDQNERMTTVADGLGRVLAYTYDGLDRIIKVSDGARNVNLAYTADDLTSVIDVAGNSTTYTYEAGGLITSTQRPEGNIPFSQIFDAQNRVVSQTNADGHTSTFSYGSTDTSLTDPEGNLRVHTHSAEGELTGVEDQTGQSFHTTYDTDGRISSLTDRLGDTTSFSFHSPSGKLESITYADGTSTSQTYTGRPFGNVTQFDLTQTTLQDGATIHYTYDAQGNRLSITDPLGNSASSTYNSKGRLLTTTNRIGGVRTYTYDTRQRPG